MVTRGLYRSLISFLLLSFFLCGNTDTAFFQSEVLEEEEERLEETEDSEIERFFATNKGDDGLNYVPEFDYVAVIPDQFEVKQIQIEEGIYHLDKTIPVQAHFPEFYILYHSLKLDC